MLGDDVVGPLPGTRDRLPDSTNVGFSSPEGEREFPHGGRRELPGSPISPSGLHLGGAASACVDGEHIPGRTGHRERDEYEQGDERGARHGSGHPRPRRHPRREKEPMTIPRYTPLFPTLLLLTSLGCGDGPSGGPGADAPTGEGLTLVLPALFSIMAGLEGGMARLDRGLWAERFDTIAAGARTVADHPPIPAAEAERIRSVLGDEMTPFQELDRLVHDLAVRIAEAAEQEALGEVMDAQADLRTGCVTCHSEFRRRLREGLR